MSWVGRTRLVSRDLELNAFDGIVELSWKESQISNLVLGKGSVEVGDAV